MQWYFLLSMAIVVNSNICGMIEVAPEPQGEGEVKKEFVSKFLARTKSCEFVLKRAGIKLDLRKLNGEVMPPPAELEKRNSPKKAPKETYLHMSENANGQISIGRRNTISE